MPKTCENFLGLCAKGYYNGVIFHRLIRNFMVLLAGWQRRTAVCLAHDRARASL